MASRISQMRNGLQPYPQTPQHQSQQALNESIERARAAMEQFKNTPNMEAAMMNLLKQNPQIGFLSNALRNGQSLEGIAKSMAQAGGYDINEIIKGLQGGM